MNSAVLKISNEQRRIEQVLRLTSKRRSDSQLKAYKLVVAYFDDYTFKGWHAFLKTYGGRGEIWIDGHKRELIKHLMGMYPIIIPPLFGALEFDLWQQWKAEFAKRFARRQQNKRPIGVDYIWWDGQTNLKLKIEN